MSRWQNRDNDSWWYTVGDFRILLVRCRFDRLPSFVISCRAIGLDNHPIHARTVPTAKKKAEKIVVENITKLHDSLEQAIAIINGGD